MKIIVRDLGNLECAEIYPLADLHIGDPTCDIKLFRKWKEFILENDNRYVVLNGDLCNTALKDSKSDVYADTLSPDKQIEVLKKELYPIKDRILAATTGNHENRIKRSTGIDPMRYMFSELGIGEVYRPNGAFVKVTLGKGKNGKRLAYTLYLSHVTSSSLPTVERFCGNLDNIDMFLFSHTHRPLVRPIRKVSVDTRNNRVTERDCYILVTASYLKWVGSYGQARSFQPQSNLTGYYRLSGTSKKVNVII